MKLVKKTAKGFQYELNQEDVHSLRFLLKEFPLTAFSPVAISKTDPDAAEREKLLNESLAAYRNELMLKAQNLVNADKFKVSGGNQLYSISLEGRETMLQILNDIRVESWRSLGEPENLEMNIFDLSKEKVRYYHLMHVAGYFEYNFLNLEEDEK